jgi:hypothetical protein
MQICGNSANAICIFAIPFFILCDIIEAFFERSVLISDYKRLECKKKRGRGRKLASILQSRLLLNGPEPDTNKRRTCNVE